jgi:hypothetical protein
MKIVWHKPIKARYEWRHYVTATVSDDTYEIGLSNDSSDISKEMKGDVLQTFQRMVKTNSMAQVNI